MSATESIAPTSRLWTADGFQEDHWQRAEDLGALDGNASVVLPLGVFLALDPAVRESVIARLGVEVQPGEAIEQLTPFLKNLPLVVLVFPKFSDGRSFSKAELLRSRHGYKGEIRATGDVLYDQIPHMLRCGFSAFEVKNEATLRHLESGRRGGIPLYYQPSAAAPAKAGRYAWRRLAQ